MTVTMNTAVKLSSAHPLHSQDKDIQLLQPLFGPTTQYQSAAVFTENRNKPFTFHPSQREEDEEKLEV